MTPLETYIVEGDQEGAQVCRAALQQIPTPETLDIALIFNPEGLSNHELEKLAELGATDALDKLCQHWRLIGNDWQKFINQKLATALLLVHKRGALFSVN